MLSRRWALPIATLVLFLSIARFVPPFIVDGAGGWAGAARVGLGFIVYLLLHEGFHAWAAWVLGLKWQKVELGPGWFPGVRYQVGAVPVRVALLPLGARMQFADHPQTPAGLRLLAAAGSVGPIFLWSWGGRIWHLILIVGLLSLWPSVADGLLIWNPGFILGGRPIRIPRRLLPQRWRSVDIVASPLPDAPVILTSRVLQREKAGTVLDAPRSRLGSVAASEHLKGRRLYMVVGGQGKAKLYPIRLNEVWDPIPFWSVAYTGRPVVFNRRRYRRLRVRWRGRVWGEDRHPGLVMEILDVSRFAVRFLSPRALTEGARVTVALPVGKGALTRPGQVVTVREHPGGRFEVVARWKGPLTYSRRQDPESSPPGSEGR